MENRLAAGKRKHKRWLGSDEGGPDLEREVRTWTEVDRFE